MLIGISSLCCLSCGIGSEGVYTDDTTENYQLYDYYIDEYGNEGIVACRTSKYIIVISADETSQPWGPTGERIYKKEFYESDSELPGLGVAMLQIMRSKGIERFPAQNWCDMKNMEEELPRAGSWRLPTFHELELIFGEQGANVGKLNLALRSIGGEDIRTGEDDRYWTCAEDLNGYIVFTNNTESDYEPENRAVVTSSNFTAYVYKDRWVKKNKNYVRAIKYIYYEK